MEKKENEAAKKTAAKTNEKKASTKLWMKIFNVQKGMKGFLQKEDSAKEKPNGDAAYKYTPGWEINREFHRLLDENVLLCECSDVYSQNQIVDTWVNKLINGVVTPVTKREMLYTVYKEYWFRDPETGERTPAVRSMGVGMNGFDKSAATANSVAERYFILKYFHVPCVDKASELDAHDENDIPGLDNVKTAPAGWTKKQAEKMTKPAMPLPTQTVQGQTTVQNVIDPTKVTDLREDIDRPQTPAETMPEQTEAVQETGTAPQDGTETENAAGGQEGASLFPEGSAGSPKPQEDRKEKTTPEKAWSMAAETVARYAEGTVTYQKMMDKVFQRLEDYGYADCNETRKALEDEARNIRNGNTQEPEDLPEN